MTGLDKIIIIESRCQASVERILNRLKKRIKLFFS